MYILFWLEVQWKHSISESTEGRDLNEIGHVQVFGHIHTLIFLAYFSTPSDEFVAFTDQMLAFPFFL